MVGNQDKPRKVITVDGLAGSGKTTLAKALAKRLNYVHFHTGAIYRVVGLLALSTGINLQDEAGIVAILKSNPIVLRHNPGLGVEAWVGQEHLSKDQRLNLPATSEAASTVAQHPLVRAELVQLQREALPGFNLVAEGRDMGTVIFPDAVLKFFVVADLDVRIKRRISQLASARQRISQDQLNLLKKEMEIEIVERDKRDSQRPVAPTVAAQDAIVIDNSTERLTDLVEKMYDLVSQRGV